MNGPERILLVEDDRVNQQVARSMLEGMGYHVDSAWNGLEALEHYQPDQHDAVLMDLHMPMMDGMEATRQLLKRYPDAPPRIIALTANAFNETRNACLELGMENFLTKPIRIDDLDRALRGTMVEFEPESALSEEIDFDLFNSLMGGEAGALCRPVFEEFIVEMKQLPSQLQQLWREEQVDQFILAAHSAKGSAGTFGLAGVSRRLGDLELAAKLGGTPQTGATAFDVEWVDDLANALAAGIRVLKNSLS